MAWLRGWMLGALLGQDRVAPSRPETVANGPSSAIATLAGVTITASPERWEGIHLFDDELIAVHVTVDNDSDHALLVRYEHLAIMAADGRVYRPIARDHVETLEVSREIRARLIEDGLPEQDLGGQALASGYLYFERVPLVGFRFALVDAAGRALGELQLPFRPHRPEGVDDPGITWAPALA